MWWPGRPDHREYPSCVRAHRIEGADRLLRRGGAKRRARAPESPGPDCTLYALASLRAAAAGHALVLDDLAIKVVLGLDNAAKEHTAVQAGAHALE
jgi:hypothetical protein